MENSIVNTIDTFDEDGSADADNECDNAYAHAARNTFGGFVKVDFAYVCMCIYM